MGFFSRKEKDESQTIRRIEVDVDTFDGTIKQRVHRAVDEAAQRRPAKRKGTEAAAVTPPDLIEQIAIEQKKLDKLQADFATVREHELELEQQAAVNPALLSLGIDLKRDGRDLEVLLRGGAIGEGDSDTDWRRLARAYRNAIARQSERVQAAHRAAAGTIYDRRWRVKHREALESIAWSLLALVDAVQAEEKLAGEMAHDGCFGSGMQYRPFLRLGPGRDLLTHLLKTLGGITRVEQLL